MTTTAKIKLTAIQIDMLMHRLEATDALANVYADTHAEDHDPADYEQAYQRYYDACYDRADAIWRELTANGCDLSVIDCTDELTRWILADAIEGSTWLAACEFEVEPLHRGVLIRSFRSLADKVGKLIGRELELPSEAQ